MDQTLIDNLPFARHLGIELLEADKTRIVARLEVKPEHCTTATIMHGGAIMALADTLGAIGAFLNLPEGAGGTTTLESKTNFLGSARVNTTVRAETVPVHVGRRTSVWQTSVFDERDRKVALVTQTQLVL